MEECGWKLGIACRSEQDLFSFFEINNNEIGAVVWNEI